MHSWKKAVYEPFADERLHESVRALDAVMLLPIGESRRHFVSKGRVLPGGSHNADGLLGELYDLRSSTEHLNDLDVTLVHILRKGDRS